jgi:ornithine cyclodeaminase/alanine dehydrogenase-like protein (mu-crystallin family)
MRIVTADDLERIFTFPRLIEALRDAFRSGIVTPLRHHHRIERNGEPDATLLLMPAWGAADAANGGHVGVKIVSLYPANASRGLPTISGSYLLMAGDTGMPLALVDGAALTLWRTAAASALAASYLARKDAARLVMVGAGALAPYLIGAHASVRPIRHVAIWNHNPERAARLAADLAGRSFSVEAARDLEAAVREADVVSCATMASDPLVKGEWLKPGAHLDLVGAFTPAMRETDDTATRRARVFVDTRAGALKEAGDIVQPLASGAITEADISGDLFDLCRTAVPGRESDGEITLFKSVGTGLEDLAAAALAVSEEPRAAAN